VTSTAKSIRFAMWSLGQHLSNQAHVPQPAETRTCPDTTLPSQGVMLRGRLRKFANQQNSNLLTENDEDGEIVRFAIIAGFDPAIFITFIQSIVPNAIIPRVRENVSNPVLSKLKVDEDDRYTIS